MNDPSEPKAGGLWSRLFTLGTDNDEPKPDADRKAAHALVADAPTADAAPELAPLAALPIAEAPSAPVEVAELEPPVAAPAVPDEPVVAVVEPAEILEPIIVEELDIEEIAAEAVIEEEVPIVEAWPAAAPEVPKPTARPVAPTAQPCPACGTVAKPGQRYCEDCGWMFNEAAPVVAAAAPTTSPVLSTRGSDMPTTTTKGRLRNRYELRQSIGERHGTQRHRGFDHTAGQGVVVVATPQAPVVAIAEAAIVDADEIMPGFDEDVPVAAVVTGGVAWPGAAWEKQILEAAKHSALPRVVDFFTEGDTDYLVLDQPIGTTLWDAWDEAEDAATRYGWAKQIAEALHALHQAGAILEGVRPDLVVVNDSGLAAFTDLSDLLPLPLPASPPLRANLFTAPELILSPQTADARADLYSFGALLYSLEYLHHSPEEKDFERQFVPRQITDKFPDVHPLLLRIINKTFVRDVNTRFPTDEAGRTDPTGFTELIRTLEICQQTFDKVRLDIAAWTTTGMVRTGNEDAFSVLHAVEQRQDDMSEFAVVCLCDGMGGYEAGEVAAALAMAKMREFVLQQPMFAALAGKEPPTSPPDIKALQDVMNATLRHANREVYNASRTPGKGRRGMGCTAECVYIDTRNVVVGHVGDSRTYHLRRGRLLQLTRDQTFVNRMVELGQLSAAEAENHPRKNELQQAIGGQPDVVPGVSASKLQRGDWILVCSDGLTNHITNVELEKMLTREASSSAEDAARRLLNLTNLRGATDNATIVVVRAS
jgi:PPM family protein phosphatase